MFSLESILWLFIIVSLYERVFVRALAVAPNNQTIVTIRRYGDRLYNSGEQGENSLHPQFA